MGIKSCGKQYTLLFPFYMAKTIQTFQVLGGEAVPTFMLQLPVKAGGSGGSILPGYLVIADGSNAGYVKAAPDATISTDLIVGVANAQSTETASVDGFVTFEAAPVLIVKIKAKTPANLVSTMKFTNKYQLDVTSGNYTLDQGTTTNGIFRLIDFDNTTDGNCIASVQCNFW